MSHSLFSWVAGILSSSMETTTSKTSTTSIQVTTLNRYAVKGLSADDLDRVDLTISSSCFPDDRRYALLKKGREWKEGEWLHKQNFLCAFTHPELLAKFEASYQVLQSDDDDDDNNDTPPQRRLLELKDRATGQRLVGPIDMATEMGRAELAKVLSEQSGEQVVCVTSESGEFQFGNTPAGVANGDSNARSIHSLYERIVFQATVDALQEKIGVPLNPTRFRPNIVLKSDAPAWSEFEWIGKTLVSESSGNPLKLKVINKAVRCKAVSVDPLDPENVLDIPELLTKHFREHGPYLGVYCAVEEPGSLSIGEKLYLVN